MNILKFRAVVALGDPLTVAGPLNRASKFGDVLCGSSLPILNGSIATKLGCWSNHLPRSLKVGTEVWRHVAGLEAVVSGVVHCVGVGLGPAEAVGPRVAGPSSLAGPP